jgi:hypothetical protein
MCRAWRCVNAYVEGYRIVAAVLPIRASLEAAAEYLLSTSGLLGDAMPSHFRSYVTAGVAVVGAGVIVAAATAPPPDIQVTATGDVNVQFAAVPTWITDLSELAEEFLAAQAELVLDEITNPAPILRQIIANQLANGRLIGGAAVDSATALGLAVLAAPAVAAELIDTAINNPAALPDAVADAVGELASVPVDVASPLVEAATAVFTRTLANTADVAVALATTVPELVTTVIDAHVEVFGKAIVTNGLAVVSTAVNDPASLPAAAGRAIVNIETEAAEQIGNMEAGVLNVRDSVVEALEPTSRTDRRGDAERTLALIRNSTKAEPTTHASGSTKQGHPALKALRDQAKATNERVEQAVAKTTQRVRDAVDNVSKRSTNADDDSAQDDE